MIPFEDIDARLGKIEKDRAWLAENTPYSQDYIRTVLAKNSKRRTSRVQEVLSAAIERQEALRDAPESTPSLPDRITVEVPSEKFNSYLEAADYAGQNLKVWTIHELDRAAEEWLRLKNYKSLTSVADEPIEFPREPLQILPPPSKEDEAN